MDRSEVDAVLVRQQPARIDRGGLCPFGHTDALPRQLFGPADPAVGANVDRRVTEHPGREHRQRNEARVVLGRQRDDLGERHFGDVEFAAQQKAVEHLLDRQSQHVELDSRNRHGAVEQVANVVVFADREGERDLRHGRSRSGQSSLTPIVLTILPYLS
jgi:hypothetical protein